MASSRGVISERQLARGTGAARLWEADIVDLRKGNLVACQGLDRCPAVSMLLLSWNRLKSLAGLSACGELWWLDASHNPLTGVSSLARLACMGHLDVSFTNVTPRALSALSSVPIVHLKVLEGTPKLQQDSAEHTRLLVVALLPNVWVLDDVLVTVEERQRAAEFAAHLPDNLKKLLPEEGADSKWTTVMSASRMATSFRDVMARHPDRPERVDSYRLRMFATYYTVDAARLNHFSSMRTAPAGIPALRMPLLHLHAVLSLPPDTLVDLCTVLSTAARYDVPSNIVQDSMLIMLASAMPVSCVGDLSMLGKAASGAVVHLAHTLVTQANTVQSNEAAATVALINAGLPFLGDGLHVEPYAFPEESTLSAVSPFVRSLWDAFSERPAARPAPAGGDPASPTAQALVLAGVPPGTPDGLRVPGLDEAERARRREVAATMAQVDTMLIASGEASAEVEVVSSPEAVIARHAALLLARSPSFPPIVPTPSAPPPSRKAIATRKQLLPLLKAAHLASPRVTATRGRSRPPGTSGSDRWHRQPAPATLLDSQVSVLSEEDPFDGAAALQASSIGLVSVRPSTRLPGGVDLQASLHSTASTASRYVQLHRRTAAVAESGVPHATGVVNLAVGTDVIEEARALREERAPPLPEGPRGEIPLPMAPVHGYVLNGTWNAKFVVAADDIVVAQNHVAYECGALEAPTGEAGGWAPLNSVPFVASAPAVEGAPGPPAIINNAHVAPSAYQVDGLFTLAEEAIAPTKTNVHTLVDNVVKDTTLALKQTGAPPVLALDDAPDAAPGRRSPRAGTRAAAAAPSDAAHGTFLTGVDTGAELDWAAAPGPARTPAGRPPVAPPPAPPAGTAEPPPAHRSTDSVSVAARWEAEEAALQAGTVADARNGDRNWFAVPGRSRFVVCPEQLPFAAPRTKPDRGDMDRHLRGKARSNPVAAFVPVSKQRPLDARASVGVKPISRPVSRASAHRAELGGGFSVSDDLRARPAARQKEATPASSSFRGRALSASSNTSSQRRGVQVNSLSLVPVDTAPPAPATTRSPSPASPEEVEGGEEAIEVDDDGYYAVTVPGVGKAFASIDGPAPNVGLLAEFASFMRKRPTRSDTRASSFRSARSSSRKSSGDMLRGGSFKSAGRMALSNGSMQF